MIQTGILNFFNRKNNEETKSNQKKLAYAPVFSGGTPTNSNFGDNAYASDLVVESIRCKANEFKKLKPRHIMTVNGHQSVINDSSIAMILKRPNPYMTTADFLEKITILLELNKNVYIYPEYYMTQSGKRHYTAIYPLKPATVDYLVDGNNNYYLRFRFNNGYEVTLRSDQVIHWRKDYGVNDYFGGNAFGGNDDIGLMTMLQRYDQLTESIAKALNCSYQINGIMEYNSYEDDDEKEAARKDFEKRLNNNDSGVIFTDLGYKYTPLSNDPKLVDAETLKFFQETILRANGTSLPILNGDYSKEQKEAYYEHALEGDIISLGQALSKGLFSDREQGFGNEIILYPNNIIFMSMENKIEALKTFVPAGLLLKDEAREMLGYPPLPDGQGQVISQGYNNLLDNNNNNIIANNKDGETNNGEQE